MSHSIVVAGGGTAGHIEPAMNLADAVRRLDPTSVVTALGTTKGLDTALIPPRGYPLELVPPVPLPRRLNRALLATPGKVRDAVRAASVVLERVQADVVVGFGGYVAVPAYLAARRLPVPIVVHEANAKPGLANRGAARLTTHVFTATEAGHLPHATRIGIPLRPAISGLDRAALRARARERFGLRPDLPTLLVFGGSQGAQSINRAVAGAIGGLRPWASRCCTSSAPRTPSRRRTTGRAVRRRALRRRDAVRLRRGRLRAVPLRGDDVRRARRRRAARDLRALPGGQRRAALQRPAHRHAGGGLLVEDRDLTADWILREVAPLVTDPARLQAMSQAAARTGSRDADVVLARHVLSVAEEHRRFAGGPA